MKSPRISLSLAIIVLIMISTLFLTSCENDSDGGKSTDSVTEVPMTTSPVTEPEVLNEHSVIDKFIELYNTSNTNPIYNLAEMDIQGDDYRTEFRLNAFENAVGQKGAINGGTVQIVNYGVWSNDTIRVYAATDTYENAIDLYTTIIHILDSTITDDEIADQYSGFSHTGSSTIYLGNAGFISGYIETSYANGGVDGYEIMIDCSKILFTN